MFLGRPRASGLSTFQGSLGESVTGIRPSETSRAGLAVALLLPFPSAVVLSPEVSVVCSEFSARPSHFLHSHVNAPSHLLSLNSCQLSASSPELTPEARVPGPESWAPLTRDPGVAGSRVKGPSASGGSRRTSGNCLCLAGQPSLLASVGIPVLAGMPGKDCSPRPVLLADG